MTSDPSGESNFHCLALSIVKLATALDKALVRLFLFNCGLGLFGFWGCIRLQQMKLQSCLIYLSYKRQWILSQARQGGYY